MPLRARMRSSAAPHLDAAMAANSDTSRRAGSGATADASADADLAAQVIFLEQRLDAAWPTALAWQSSWTGIYAASFASNLVGALDASDGNDRVREIVDAAKSGIATAQMVTLFATPWLLSRARNRCGMSRATTGRRACSVALGERQLLSSAARAETRYSLRRHLITIGANLIGGAAT